MLSQPHIPPRRRHWTPGLVYRAIRGWGVPYFQSRALPGGFHPIIAYLFTEWKCNLDCHYCWALDNSVKGMTEDVAERGIHWLHSTTCPVLALMGGEPLLRPQFVYKVVDYAAKKDFWAYIPTNGRLLRPEEIDRLGDSGAAIFNLVVDAVDSKAGRPRLPGCHGQLLVVSRRASRHGRLTKSPASAARAQGANFRVPVYSSTS